MTFWQTGLTNLLLATIGWTSGVGVWSIVAAPWAAAADASATRAPVDGMIWIPAGEFAMGSDTSMFADALPVHRVALHGFWMDATEVTNAEFRRFVDQTHYVTVAEQPLRPADYPDVDPKLLVPGANVFSAPEQPVTLDDETRWWRFVPGANWRHPEGPRSTITSRMNHPVVQVAYADAVAYAKWTGKRLPTEAEWEYAARGGLKGKEYVWGSEAHPGGRQLANTFQGNFPSENSSADGYRATSPVRAFPPNAFGLYGMAGNAWEWVADWYRADYYAQLAAAASVSRNPQGPVSGYDPSDPALPKRVQRGGSFLCTDEYCASYRPGARGKGDPGSPAIHLGFRLVKDAR
jgi:formylglycine-generating enzyme required for sulfatase activity